VKTSLYLRWMVVVLLAAGCAASKKIVVWEGAAGNPPRNYEIVGPVSVTEQVAESGEAMVQGIAGFISKDGRISDQMPPEMRQALDAKKEVYKDMIYDKLADKAREYDADAVIGAEYFYVPPFASFSTKATVSAKGTMVRYR
jgi:hypothetical protein